MDDARELLQIAKEKQTKWDGRSKQKIGKVDNLSQYDLKAIELYATTYLIFGDIFGLVKPQFGIKAVLEEYGISAEKSLNE